MSCRLPQCHKLQYKQCGQHDCECSREITSGDEVP